MYKNKNKINETAENNIKFSQLSHKILSACPVGAIIPVIYGYFTGPNNTGYTSIGPNTEAAMNALFNPKGFYVCNGALKIRDIDSPIYNETGRYLPKINDDRFLMGSQTNIGVLGGSNVVKDHLHSMVGSVNVTGGNFTSMGHANSISISAPAASGIIRDIHTHKPDAGGDESGTPTYMTDGSHGNYNPQFRWFNSTQSLYGTNLHAYIGGGQNHSVDLTVDNRAAITQTISHSHLATTPTGPFNCKSTSTTLMVKTSTPGGAVIAHGLSTGDAICFTETQYGITKNTVYYAYVASTTAFYLVNSVYSSTPLTFTSGRNHLYYKGVVIGQVGTGASMPSNIPSFIKCFYLQRIK